MSGSSTNISQLREAILRLNEGNAVECEHICNTLLARHPLDADVNHVLALSYRAQGKLLEAELAGSRALSQSSRNPSVLNSYGLILLDQGKVKLAQKMFIKAIKLEKSMAAAHANLGHAEAKIGQLDKAEESYRRALDLNPSLPDALIHLALLLRDQGRISEYDFPSDFLSDTPSPHPGLAMIQGLIALDDGLYEKAEKLFLHALKTQPQSEVLWVNLGLSFARQDKKEKAHEAYVKAINLDPQLFEAKLNLADLWKYESPTFARAHLLDAVKLKPSDKIAQDMLGFTWFMDNYLDAALECFQRALDIDPSFDQAIYHKAGAYFLKGDFVKGWKEYNRKYGPTGLTGSPIADKIPLWDQKLPSQEPILVWTDQGLGDEIMQLGLIADAYERKIPLTVATSERLVPIATRSFPNIVCISKDSLTHETDKNMKFSAQCSATFIAPIVRKSYDEFPKRASFLTTSKDQTEALRQKYLNRGHEKKLLIGLSWRSSNSAFGSHKSLPLSTFLPLLNNNECIFVNLQYGETQRDISELPEDIRHKIITDGDIDPLIDMDSFASQVGALDLVLTTSNTTAHMAGALGRPTWTLVPRMGPGWLWYWFEETATSPWYPSMRIYRQAKNGSWNSALTAITAQLGSFIKESQSLTGN
jgi:Tfp pilus assembly protein PilF/ADP-heptose:LPS heptosyltransferase